MDNDEDIFVTKSKDDKKKILTKLEVMQTIPQNAINIENKIAQQTCKELRWRIFKLPNKKNEFIEISYKHPKEERMFLNKNGKWINDNIPIEYDIFLINQYYIYEKI
jgi:hypothetical protein